MILLKIFGKYSKSMVIFENFENLGKFWIFLKILEKYWKILEKNWKFWEKVERIRRNWEKIGWWRNVTNKRHISMIYRLSPSFIEYWRKKGREPEQETTCSYRRFTVKIDIIIVKVSIIIIVIKIHGRLNRERKGTKETKSWDSD